jgi:hypothetical protein
VIVPETPRLKEGIIPVVPLTAGIGSGPDEATDCEDGMGRHNPPNIEGLFGGGTVPAEGVIEGNGCALSEAGTDI